MCNYYFYRGYRCTKLYFSRVFQRNRGNTASTEREAVPAMFSGSVGLVWRHGSLVGLGFTLEILTKNFCLTIDVFLVAFTEPSDVASWHSGDRWSCFINCAIAKPRAVDVYEILNGKWVDMKVCTCVLPSD